MITNKQNIYEALENTLRQEGYEAGHAAGFAHGYAQALADLAEFTKNRQPPAVVPIASIPEDQDRQRRPKGENARLVKEALSSVDRPLNPSDIRRLVESRENSPITYSSTRNSLHQLKEEGVVVDENGKWSLKREGSEV